MTKESEKMNISIYQVFKVPQDLPSVFLGYHKLLEVTGKLVPDPKERRDHVDLRSGLVRDITRTESEM